MGASPPVDEGDGAGNHGDTVEGAGPHDSEDDVGGAVRRAEDEVLHLEQSWGGRAMLVGLLRRLDGSGSSCRGLASLDDEALG